MKRVLKKGLSLFLALLIMFSSAFAGVDELDFSGVFDIEAAAISTMGSYGENVSWTIDDKGLLRVYAYETGGIKDWHDIDSPWHNFNVASYIEDVFVDEEITYIGVNAFQNCENLTSITISTSVTSIGDFAFRYCTSLTNVNYEGTKTQWEQIAIGRGNEALTNAVISFSNSFVDPVEALSYELNDDEQSYYVSLCDDNVGGELVIPDEYNGKPVTGIGYQAFSGCVGLTSITIPDSVTKIYSSAFSGCSLLVSVSIPDSVKYIYSSAFGSCKSLKSINIPDGVTQIYDYTFSSCSSLENVVLPDSVTYIGKRAFSQCSNISTITIPMGVTYIGEEAFYSCIQLSSITIPDGVTYIGAEAFCSCGSLKSINVGENNVTYAEVDGVLFNKSKTELIQYPAAKEDSAYVIPNGVTTIERYAFSSCNELKSVTIPDSVTNIKYSGFAYCGNIETITIGKGLKNVGDFAFIGCRAVKRVNISDLTAWCNIKYEYSAMTAYGGCSPFMDSAEADLYLNGELLTDVVIPDGITKIGDFIFSKCNSIKNVKIPDSVTTIGHGAFAYCENLESIAIPISVENIEDFVFYDCYDLQYVFYQGSESEWANVSIGDSNSQMDDAVIHYNATDHTYGDVITIEPTCTKDGETYCLCSVCGYKHIIEKKTATGHVGEGDVCTVCGSDKNIIQSSHPYENDMYEMWTIYKEGAKRIAITFSEDTFTEWNCDSIFIYGANDVYVGNYSGNQLAGRKIVVPGDTVKIHLTTDGSDVYYGFSLDEVKAYYEECTHAETEIRDHRPAGCYDGYTGDTYCIECNEFLAQGEKIPGTGHVFEGDYCDNCGAELWEYWVNEDNEVELSGYNGNETDVVIPDTLSGLPVTNIGECAFEGNTKITSVVIPNSVKVISYCAFNACTSLENVVLGKGLETIGDHAFGGCESLTSIVIPDTVELIDWGAFDDCTNLVSVKLPKNLEVLGAFAFQNCKKLVSITLPDGLLCISIGAFWGCEELTSIAIPGSVIDIGGSVFADCKKLTSVTIPDSVTGIDSDAFTYSGYYYDDSNWENGVLYIGNHLLRASRCVRVEGSDTDEYIDMRAEGNYVVKQDTVSIANCAFLDSNVISVEIPDSVKEIGYAAFSNVKTLRSINVDSNNAFYASVDDVLFNKDKTTILSYPPCKVNNSYVIPNGVTSIAACAFYGCENLKEVVIPDGVTSVGSEAFKNCTNLESITIPKTLTETNTDIFKNCCSLKSVIYSGTEEEWLELYFGYDDGNEEINNAKIHFNATEHIYGDLLTREPTCDVDGLKYYQCSVCDYEKVTERTPAYGHSFENGFCTVCGSDFDSTVHSSHPYENNTDKTWTIYKEGAKRIAITFSEDTFTEWDCDWIYIYDSDDEYIGSYTGDDLAGRRIVVQGDTVKINLVSDSSGTYYGFSLDEVKAYYEECTHPETIIRYAYPAGCYDGYTGDTYCVECNELLEWGENIPGTGHVFEGDYCDNCGAELWEYWINEDDEVEIYRYNGNETDVVIPDTLSGLPVTTIGNCAFENCSNLVTITISDKVTSIGYNVFWGCKSLNFIIVDENNAHYTDIDGILFNKAQTEIVQYPAGKLDSQYIIPDGVNSIYSRAFSLSENLIEVIIPDSVTAIYNSAFSGCKKLKVLIIPNSVTSMGEGVFAGCTSLEEIRIPTGITEIPCAAFSGCESLTSIVVPDNVELIALSAFSNCTSLTSITIPDSVTEIRASAFYNTGYYNDESNWEDGVLYIGNHLVVGYKDDDDGDRICIKGDYAVKPGTKTIAGLAFELCEELSSVTLPDSVTNIGLSAFSSCSSLVSVDFGNGVTQIGSGAFWGCSELGSITIPDSVTSIGSGAFKNTAYYNDESNWVDGVLYIGDYLVESGKYDQYTDEYIGVKGDYIVKEGTKIIADSAFNSSSGLTSVEIPGSVMSIGYTAFAWCTDLTSVKIGDGVERIAEYTFYRCEDLKSVTIPGSVTEIGERAFGYSYDDDYGEEMKIPGFTIYGKEGSAAEAYAVENGFKFVPTTDEPELPIHGTEGTQIDYENFVIRTSVQSAEDIIEILGVSEKATVEAAPSYKCGDVELYGTGAIVSVYDGDEFVGDFTLVVEGDTNGDSVCDVLDCFEIERNSNGNNSLSGAYAMAGDTNADGVIDASDYQEAINKAVA